MGDEFQAIFVGVKPHVGNLYVYVDKPHYTKKQYKTVTMESDLE